MGSKIKTQTTFSLLILSTFLPSLLHSFHFSFCFAFVLVLFSTGRNSVASLKKHFLQGESHKNHHIHGRALNNMNIAFETKFSHDYITCIFWYIKIWLECAGRVAQAFNPRIWRVMVGGSLWIWIPGYPELHRETCCLGSPQPQYFGYRRDIWWHDLEEFCFLVDCP